MDYYKTLEINSNASTEDIRKSYKRLALQWHPDKNPTNQTMATIKFGELSRAYEILSNPSKRQKYDYQRRLKRNVNESHRNSSYTFRSPEEIFREFCNNNYSDPKIIISGLHLNQSHHNRVLKDNILMNKIFNHHEASSNKIFESIHKFEYKAQSMNDLSSVDDQNLRTSSSTFEINKNSVGKRKPEIYTNMHQSTSTSYTTIVRNGKKISRKKVIDVVGENTTISVYDGEILISKTINSVPQLLETVI